jgi:Kef-type K+ transport system membrane component KefB
MRGSFDFLREAPIHQAVATSVVLGTVMVAQSPAVVVALRDETSAEGPMIRTVLAVVVIADLLVIVLFALSSAGAKAAFGVAGALGATLATLAWQVLGSFLAGTLMGALLALYLRKVRGGAALFVLTVAFVMAEVGGRLAFDPLLVALVAGIFVRSLSAAHERLAQAVGASGLPIYAVFFAVAGARIHLDALGKLAWPLVVLFLVRAAGLVGGTRIAARIAAAPPEVRRYAGWGLVPQAGLALALALLFAKLFPEFGAEGVSLAVGLVALNELTAPIAFRFALVRSGEAGRRAAPADLEFGAAADPSESEALALDRRAPG